MQLALPVRHLLLQQKMKWMMVVLNILTLKKHNVKIVRLRDSSNKIKLVE
ncbi:MAG: hypothetical protein MJZ20_14675 [Bacteroidaceae bacterium]|nr:hypothetical protein [Bacteroidaceae bacterium]